MFIHMIGTGYFPDPSAMEGGFEDAHDHPLNTLQDLLLGYTDDDRFGRKGKAPYVSAAMDPKSQCQGCILHCMELEREHGQSIPIKVCDTGGAFMGKGDSRIDICCRDEKASLDEVINGRLSMTLEAKS